MKHIIAIIVTGIMFGGFFTLQPNEARLLVLFGEYKGTVRESGFHWANPFFVKKKISLRARNLESEPIKVNDKVGNPIMLRRKPMISVPMGTRRRIRKVLWKS